ncbi:MAG: NAD-binding protein [Planctomyces sp.]
MWKSLAGSPWLVPAILLGLVGTAAILRRRQPRIYRDLSQRLRQCVAPLILVYGAGAVSLAVWGLQRRCPDVGLLQRMYEAIQLLLFNMEADVVTANWQLKTAAVLSILLTLTVAGGGILLWFHESWQTLALRGTRGHVVVCGLGSVGSQVLRDLLERRDGRQLVAIDSDADSQMYSWATEMGVLTLKGDVSRADILRKARVSAASEIFIVTGRDVVNVECLVHVRASCLSASQASSRGRTVRCYVHLRDQKLMEVLSSHNSQLEHHGKEHFFDVVAFSAASLSAQRTLEQITRIWSLQPRANLHAKETVVHFVLFGFGEFAQQLAVQLAGLAHFPNCRRLRMTIVAADAGQAAAFTKRFPRFGPAVGEIRDWKFLPTADDWSSQDLRSADGVPADGETDRGIHYVCNVQYLPAGVQPDESILQELIGALKLQNQLAAVFVCHEGSKEDPSQGNRDNFLLAERLKTAFDRDDMNCPVLCYVSREEDQELGQLLLELNRDEGTGSRLIPFGHGHGTVGYREITGSWIEYLGRLTHLLWLGESQDLSKYEQGLIRSLVELIQDQGRESRVLSAGELGVMARLDVLSGRIWQSLSEWERQSSCAAAVHAVVKTAAMGYVLTGRGEVGRLRPLGHPVKFEQGQDETLLKMEHYRWVAERLLTGWTFVDSPDRSNKRRWQITPWEQLQRPPEGYGKTGAQEQEKDRRIVQLLKFLISTGQLATRQLAENRRQ